MGILPSRLASTATVLFASLMVFIALSEKSLAYQKSSATASVSWEPTEPVNGSPLLLTVRTEAAVKALSGTWLGHRVFFEFNSLNKTWNGVAGISFETAPAAYALELTGDFRSGKPFRFTQQIPVEAGSYRVIEITVPKKFTEPNAEQLQRIAADKLIKQAVLGEVTPTREWKGLFSAPVEAATSDVFGTQRTFNGKVQGVHQGLDFAVPIGTPVSAVNSGRVLLARELYFEGNCVVLDHGQGLLTLYLHLSRLDVRPGEAVTRGQRLGLSGGTGRATGPHLHLAVRWQGVYLNPATLLQLRTP